MFNSNQIKNSIPPVYRSRITVVALQIKEIIVTKEPLNYAANTSKIITELKFDTHVSIFVSRRYTMLYAVEIDGYYVREESGIETYMNKKSFEANYSLITDNDYVSAQWTPEQICVLKYPETQMKHADFIEIDQHIGVGKLEHIKAIELANAAIKHAIDNGQVMLTRNIK